MPFHFWLSEISLGASYMDALHHDLVETLLHLATASDYDFPCSYDMLIVKTESVFRTEEQWMEEIGFPELKHHREQHANILGTLYHGQAQIMCGNIRYARNVIAQLLPEWLLMHASTMDRALANELRLATLAQ